MRNTSDTYTTRTDLEFRNRRRSLDRLESRHASRELRSNFRFGIFGSIRNPFPRSLAQRSAQRSTRVRVFRSFSPFTRLVQSTLVRSGTPRIQFYRSCSSVTETRARERNRHIEPERTERREGDRLPNGY